MGDAQGSDEAVALVHQYHPGFFHIKVLHTGVHIVVDGGGRAEVGPLFSLLALTTLPQLAGGKEGDGLGFADAVVSAQFADGLLAQRVEVVVAGAFEGSEGKGTADRL